MQQAIIRNLSMILCLLCQFSRSNEQFLVTPDYLKALRSIIGTVSGLLRYNLIEAYHHSVYSSRVNSCITVPIEANLPRHC